MTIFSLTIVAQDAKKPELPGGNDKWQMKWNDEFDYADTTLDKSWHSSNQAYTHILCSRWRENAVVSGGTLKLQNRKENRGGQAWTSGSIWTKEHFMYGYYECRYKYAAATGTNNSFWLMSQSQPSVGKKFEIDINEGHYPSEMATNIHNWTDITTNPTTGAQTHPASSQAFNFASRPDVTIQLEIPIIAKRVRLTSNYPSHFHIQEFRVYNVNAAGYPSPMSGTADTDKAGLVNYSRNALTKITSSGVYTTSTDYKTSNVADGGLGSKQHWVSQTLGPKWLELEFDSNKTIGCIQFVSGWLNGSTPTSVLDNYKIQYTTDTARVDAEWIEMASVDSIVAPENLARDYHYYGLKWTPESLIFYHDGREMRKVTNTFCKSAAPVYLSEAIIAWAGAVTDAIDGTQMEVDYVRIYDPVPLNSKPECIRNGGFEDTTGVSNWQFSKIAGSDIRFTSTDPAEKMNAIRVNTVGGNVPNGTTLYQKVAISSKGQYELRFNARVVNPSANSKFGFKFTNHFTNQAIEMGDTSTKWVSPTATWQSYAYKVNLDENYSGRLTFGFDNVGVYELDSVSLTRVGEVISAIRPMHSSQVQIQTKENEIIIFSNTKQFVDIFNSEGKKLLYKEVQAGESRISLQHKGLIFVRLRNDGAVTTKKLII